MADASTFLSKLFAAAGEQLGKINSDDKGNGQPVLLHHTPALLEGNVPEGFGILVQPMMERNKGGGEMKLTDIIIHPVPNLDTVAKSEKGAAYLQEVLTTAFGRKLKTSVANFKETPGSKLQFPDDLDGFIEAARRGSQLATFKTLAPKFVRALKKRGYAAITVDMLYNCFTSASFAQQIFSKIVQDQWIFLIN